MIRWLLRRIPVRIEYWGIVSRSEYDVVYRWFEEQRSLREAQESANLRLVNQLAESELDNKQLRARIAELERVYASVAHECDLNIELRQKAESRIAELEQCLEGHADPVKPYAIITDNEHAQATYSVSYEPVVKPASKSKRKNT